MAKILKPLTNTQVKQSKPREKVYALADGQGLQLRVKPNGSKLWIFNWSIFIKELILFNLVT